MHLQERIIFNHDLITRYRLENNVTQAELASQLDVNTNVISYYENGKRKPTFQAVDKLVEVTGIPYERWYEINEATFGSKITTMRLHHNISQQDMAEYIGTSVENVNRWEADKHVPSILFIYGMSKVLRTTMEDLITDSQGHILIKDPHNEVDILKIEDRLKSLQ